MKDVCVFSCDSFLQQIKSSLDLPSSHLTPVLLNGHKHLDCPPIVSLLSQYPPSVPQSKWHGSLCVFFVLLMVKMLIKKIKNKLLLRM